MSTPTNSFPAQTTIAASDTFLMNVSAASAKVTGTNVISNLGLPTLAAANTFAATNRFKTGGFNDMSIEFGAAQVGIARYNTTNLLFQIGNNAVAGGVSIGGGVAAGFGVDATGRFGFGAGGDPAAGTWDVSLGRASSGVIEVNNGAVGAGTLRDISVRNVLVNGGSMVPTTFIKTGVDLKTIAVTDVFTVPAGKTFIMQDVVLVPTTVTSVTVAGAIAVIESGGGVAMGPTASFSTATGATLATGKNLLGTRNNAAGINANCAAGNKVQISVTTGVTATTAVADFYVIGILI